MNRFFVLLGVVLASTIAHAVDATKNVTEIARSGRWMVIEFAATKQLIYRISSSATNSVDNNIVFDFVPSKKCEPTSAVMIAQQRAYSPALDDGIVLLSYKPPGQKESTELTKTAMRQGDTFAFFQFQRLTANVLLQSGDKGSLAIWVPGSGDGTVKRSENIYFSLDGFSSAHERARRMCNDNR